MPKHERWTTVIKSREDEHGQWDGWVGVSTATHAEFDSGTVHGRTVDAGAHCTPSCPAGGNGCRR